MRQSQHHGTDGHQQSTNADDARTVDPIPKVAHEHNQYAVTDLRDREKSQRGARGSATPNALNSGCHCCATLHHLVQSSTIQR